MRLTDQATGCPQNSAIALARRGGTTYEGLSTKLWEICIETDHSAMRIQTSPDLCVVYHNSAFAVNINNASDMSEPYTAAFEGPRQK